MMNRIADETRDVVKLEALHKTGSVNIHRFVAELKPCSDLFRGIAFRDEL